MGSGLESLIIGCVVTLPRPALIPYLRCLLPFPPFPVILALEDDLYVSAFSLQPPASIPQRGSSYMVVLLNMTDAVDGFFLPRPLLH